jgi:ubiquinone/menaquinone biosynthesis C-methylase UbiE
MAENLPFEDNEFDLAVFVNTIEFLDNPIQALREAGRVVRRKIMIHVVNSLSWSDLTYRLEGMFDDSRLIRFNSFHLWELKSDIYSVFGKVPVMWKSTPCFPPMFEKLGGFLPFVRQMTHCPFGSFLGVSFTIAYTMKTDNLRLKIRANKARSITGSVTPVGRV